jgi:hypothetical protein
MLSFHDSEHFHEAGVFLTLAYYARNKSAPHRIEYAMDRPLLAVLKTFSRPEVQHLFRYITSNLQVTYLGFMTSRSQLSRHGLRLGFMTGW